MRLFNKEGESFGWTGLREAKDVPQFREGADTEYVENINLPYPAGYPWGHRLLGGGIIKVGRD